MFRIRICHLVWKLCITSEFVWHWGIKRFLLIIFEIRDIVHKSRLLDRLVIPLFVISKARKIMFIFGFERTGFINFNVRSILRMQYIFSCLNIEPTLLDCYTNICAQHSTKADENMDFFI